MSKGCWNVPFDDTTTNDDGAPEYADKQILGQMASYCTMSNVQDYTLTARKPKESFYALIIVSNVHEACGNDTDRTYILDEVSIKPREEITRIRK